MTIFYFPFDWAMGLSYENIKNVKHTLPDAIYICSIYNILYIPSAINCLMGKNWISFVMSLFYLFSGRE